MLPVIKHSSNLLPFVAHYIVTAVDGERKVGPKYASLTNANCEACVVPHTKPLIELIREYAAKHPEGTSILFEAVNVPSHEYIDAAITIYRERIPAVLMHRNEVRT